MARTVKQTGSESLPASAGECHCRHAVERTYRELCSAGQPVRFAFEAAVTVYCWHHPEAEPVLAEDIVLSWLSNGVRH